MRSVIVDMARRRMAHRRGGGFRCTTLTTGIAASVQSGETEILGVHEALDNIAVHDSRMAKVVEMRYFGGMTEAEIAQAMDVNERTVRRDWTKAKGWLQLMTVAEPDVREPASEPEDDDEDGSGDGD